MEQKEMMLKFIRSNLIKNESIDVGMNDSLISSGLIDSFGLMEISFYIEKNFGKKIPDYEILNSNADTVNTLFELIEKENV